MAAIDLRQLFDVPQELDKRSSDALIRAIKENYLAEFDYLKFIQSVKTLISMGIDEETAFKSAFATAKTMGFSKDAFKKSLKHYMNVLAAQRESFAEALKRQRADKLTDRSSKNLEIKKKIESHREKIAKLSEEIRVLEEKLENSDKTMSEEREKLELVTTNFVKSFEYLDNKLKKDLELFEKYI